MTGNEDARTPEEDEVRRLLADARHTEPTPPDVVARLDRVLDDLAEETTPGAPVVDLARRRRRRVGAVLVAAAAVVVVGVGINQVGTLQPTSEDSLAGESAVESGQGQAEQPKSQSPNQGADSGEVAPFPADGQVQGKGSILALRPDRLAEDLSDFRGAPDADSKAGTSSADRAIGEACSADTWGKGEFVAVRYGDQPAVVVFRRPVGDTQVADVFLCGGEEPVRSVTLPAP